MMREDDDGTDTVESSTFAYPQFRFVTKEMSDRLRSCSSASSCMEDLADIESSLGKSLAKVSSNLYCLDTIFGVICCRLLLQHSKCYSLVLRHFLLDTDCKTTTDIWQARAASSRYTIRMGYGDKNRHRRNRETSLQCFLRYIPEYQ